jgi:hypothetical protein
MATARDLTITSWLREPGDPPFEVAVPGLKITGWWPDEPPDIKAFDELRFIWPAEIATVKTERDILEDADGGKHQVCAYVRIRRYPDRWLETLEVSLKYFVDRGAAIAWAGGWECFLQYTVTETFAGCYAAYTATTGLVCHSKLDEPITYLADIPPIPEGLHIAVAEAVDCNPTRDERGR